MEVVRPEPRKSPKKTFIIIATATIVFIAFLFVVQKYLSKDQTKAKSIATQDIFENDETFKYQREIVKLRALQDKEISDLRYDLAIIKEAKNSTIEDLEDNLGDLEQDLKNKNREIRAITLKLEQKDLVISKLKIEIDDLSNKLLDAKADLSKTNKNEDFKRYQNLSMNAPKQKISKTDSLKNESVEEYRLIRSKPASYPKRAEARQKNGSATLRFVIEASGYVSNIVIVNEEPSGWGFGKAALKAAGSLRFEPRKVNGQAVKTENVTKKYSFNVE